MPSATYKVGTQKEGGRDTEFFCMSFRIAHVFRTGTVTLYKTSSLFVKHIIREIRRRTWVAHITPGIKRFVAALYTEYSGMVSSSTFSSSMALYD